MFNDKQLDMLMKDMENVQRNCASCKRNKSREDDSYSRYRSRKNKCSYVPDFLNNIRTVVEHLRENKSVSLKQPFDQMVCSFLFEQFWFRINSSGPVYCFSGEKNYEKYQKMVKWIYNIGLNILFKSNSCSYIFLITLYMHFTPRPEIGLILKV